LTLWASNHLIARKTEDLVQRAERNVILTIGVIANIRSTAKTIADDLLSFYKANQTAGIPGIVESYFPEGGYWWGPAGGMWQVLIDYWHYTGDASYNDMIMQALLWQRGKYNDFVPDNWTTAVSNDDQGFWATAAMVAAERGFPDPPAKDNLTWISMVETVFNEYVGRYDENSCGGGMRWQILTLNFGYFEKTS
jgi:mannan endo-1,6-alpha-mannosidase